MKSLHAIILLTAIVVLLGSCKKDKDNENPSITGTWRVVPKVYLDEVSYLHFTTQGKAYRLYNSYDGYRKIDPAIYKYENGQIEWQGEPTFSTSYFLYNIVCRGDTMELHDGNDIAYKLLRDNLAPASVSDWASPVQVNDFFEDTVQAKYIAWAYSRLVTFKGYNSGTVRFYEYNPSTRQVSNATNADLAYSGTDFLNGELWCVSGQKAYKYDPGLGTSTFASVNTSPTAFLAAVAAGQGTLYGYSYGAYLDYSIIDNSWSNFREVGSEVTDMAYVDGYLYVVKGGLIHKMESSNKVPLKTWYLEGYKLSGIAHDGYNFWLSGEHTVSEQHRMLKVTLP